MKIKHFLFEFLRQNLTKNSICLRGAIMAPPMTENVKYIYIQIKKLVLRSFTKS